MKYPVISLFSGAMGLDLGLEKSGLNVVFSQDFDKSVGKTMEANKVNHLIGDIRELIEKDPDCNFIKDKINSLIEKDDEIFAIVGGPPCQSFSTAGKRLGIHDPRGSLFMEFAHTVKTFRPRFFVMENVRGLTTSKINPEDTKTALDIILETFDEIGYSYTYGILNAVDYGSPQFRERLIIIGSRDNEELFLPLPTHFQTHQSSTHRWRTLGDVIKDLEDEPGDCAKISENREKFLKYIPMGGNWKNLPLELQEEALGGAFNSGGGKTGFYRRLSYNEPSPTLVTSPVQKSSMFIHPTDDRPLSFREFARIQEFPDTWNIEGSLSNKYKQIGNAVPLSLGKAIGETLLSIANNTSTIHSKRIKKVNKK